MPTAKKRINISVSDSVNRALKKLAERDQVPTATKAESLISLALEIEEDEVWNEIVLERYTGKSAKPISHEQAWS